MPDNQIDNFGDNEQLNNQVPSDNFDEFDDFKDNNVDSDENNFDSDFDAEVEADENEDPKKYIQQLCGKLSQKLRSYNNELPKPDKELNKYVAGMINNAASEGLSQEDVKDIIDKINSDETSDEDSNDEYDIPSDNIGENKEVYNKKKLQEIANGILNDFYEKEPNDIDCENDYFSKIYTPKNFK